MAKRFDPLEISVTLQNVLFEDAAETAFAILRNLVFASPVGDPENWQNPDSAPPGYVGGHFRRNWIVSLGGVTPTVVPGAAEPVAGTLARGKAQTDRWAKSGRTQTTLVIQNNVPYARKLAEGHSLQADAGWIDESIDLGLFIPGGTRELR